MEASRSASGEPSSLVTQESRHEIQLDPAFVDRLKVAAATAIIKQKPVSMSGKEYAKQLAKRLREREDTWKAKAKNLEMELLKTKQELLLARTNTPIPHSNNENGGATTHSHSDTRTDEPTFLTPPSSSEEYPQIDHKVALSRNTNFLHSLSTLSALGRTDGDLKLLERSSEVIVGSVKTAVDYIMGKSKGKSPCHLLSSRMLQEAADAIVKSLDTRLPPGCKEDVVALVAKLVESVLEEVIGNSKICNTYSQRESCCILLRLSKSSHLLPTILNTILQKIEKVSASLRSIRHHGNYLDVQLLENSFFLFSTMEDVLVSVQTSTGGSPSIGICKTGQVICSTKETSSQLNRTTSGIHLGQTSSQTCDDEDEDDDTNDQEVRGKPGRGKTGNQTRKLSLDQGFRTNIQQRLEDSLLHISHDFPLYAQYVWRLTGILELMNE